MIAGHEMVLITGTESDDPFAIDIAVFSGQSVDVANVISLKTFRQLRVLPEVHI